MTLGRLKWPQNEVPDRKILLWRDLRRCGWIVKDQVSRVNWLRGSPLGHDRLAGLWMTRLDVTKLLWNSAGPQRLKLGSFRGAAYGTTERRALPDPPEMQRVRARRGRNQSQSQSQSQSQKQRARASALHVLVQEVLAVEGVALGGAEAGVADYAAQLFFCRAVGDACGSHYIFF